MTVRPPFGVRLPGPVGEITSEVVRGFLCHRRERDLLDPVFFASIWTFFSLRVLGDRGRRPGHRDSLKQFPCFSSFSLPPL